MYLKKKFLINVEDGPRTLILRETAIVSAKRHLRSLKVDGENLTVRLRLPRHLYI